MRCLSLKYWRIVDASKTIQKCQLKEFLCCTGVFGHFLFSWFMFHFSIYISYLLFLATWNCRFGEWFFERFSVNLSRLNKLFKTLCRRTVEFKDRDSLCGWVTIRTPPGRLQTWLPACMKYWHHCLNSFRSC